MPRIAIILGRMAMGGATLHAIGQALHLQRLGHTVFFISGPVQANETDASHLLPTLPGLQHYSISGFGRNLDLLQHFRTYQLLKQLLATLQPHLVHTHTPVAGMAGRLAASALHLPAVHTYHGLLFQGYYGWLGSRLMVWAERYLASLSSGIIAISPGLQQALVHTYRIAAAHQVTCIPVGIHLAAYQTDLSQLRHTFRQQYGLQEQEIAVAIVGRLVPVKNHDLFIEVARQAMNLLPGLRFFVVGDGESKTALLRRSRQAGLDTCYFPEEPRRADMCFTGWLPSTPTVLAGIDILMLTSLSEGTPLVLMEAMAAGKPVIATNAGSTADMLEPTGAGFVLPQQQSKPLTEKLLLLAKDSEMRKSMGTSGAKTAAAQFCAATALEQLSTWILYLIDKHQKAKKEWVGK